MGTNSDREEGVGRMKRTKIGLIGCGVIANTYARNFGKFYQKLDLAACADMLPQKSEQFAKDYHIARVCTVEELFEDSEIEIVLNLTIPRAHYELNKKAILNGKHVYCEKPLALSVREAVELQRLAEERHVMVGCAPDTFLGSALQTCRKLIDDGWIGKPVGATANMMNHGAETWHPNPDFYYLSGGGPLLDMGPYYITALVSLLGPVKESVCLRTMGMEERPIYSMPRRGERMKVEVPTHYAGALRFENGTVANMNMSFDTWLSGLPKLEIYGTEGTMIVPDPNKFGGEVRVIRSESLIDEIDGLPNSEAVGRLSRPQMWEKCMVMPHMFRQPDMNMRGIGLLDMACAIENQCENRAGVKMACHVTEVMEAMHVGEGLMKMQTSCERPRPLPAGFAYTSTDAERSPA